MRVTAVKYKIIFVYKISIKAESEVSNMDRFKKKFLKEFELMERHMGRMMRNMSLSGMSAYQSGNWSPPTDVCETDHEVIIYMEVSGISPENLSIIIDAAGITVSGVRRVPDFGVREIHQLEIDRGYFKRTIPIHVPIDVSGTSYTCDNGLIIVRLPKVRDKKSPRIVVQIS